MDLGKLAHFLAVAEHGHFGRAAGALGLSQQALSKSVAALEASLRVKLFERGQFGAVLTPYGTSLRRRAQLIEAESRLAKAEIASMRGSKEGHVKVGIGLSFVGRVMPEAMRRMRLLNPGVTITGIVESSGALFPMLLHGELDFVASAPPPYFAVDPELSQDRLFVDRDCVIVRSKHPLAKKSRVRLADMQDFPWLMSAQMSSTWSRIGREFTAAGLAPPQNLMRTDSTALAKNLVLGDDFVVLLSRENVAVELESGNLVALEMPQISEVRIAVLTTRARSILQPVALEMMRLVREVSLELHGPPP